MSIQPLKKTFPYLLLSILTLSNQTYHPKSGDSNLHPIPDHTISVSLQSKISLMILEDAIQIKMDDIGQISKADYKQAAH